MLEKIEKYFEFPEVIIENFNLMHSTSAKFWEIHKDMKLISLEQQRFILQNAIEQILKSEKSNKNLQGSGRAAVVAPLCQAQYNSDLQTCAEGSYVAAAWCGILSPTLLAALVCYGGVMAADIVCHRAADRDLELCEGTQS
ncbi:MAG: hypothetical protein JJE09_04035 [Bacteroidia bacterium]|nr:hypothetical protein [Bacteroidia bacterium]